MKKAVLYARVSSDAQRKENTIESQVLAIKRQISGAGDVLIREYIDNGYSGARLDRPGMEQLRRDLKTNLFDAIYFHNADRIARDGLFQNLIISEILKNKKQLIIDGKDYINNPENKFSLTVLGAVSELERAKIMERMLRGKQLKLAQGQLLGGGAHVYGYDYHRRTPTSQPKLVINNDEAKVVRFIFTEYAKGGISLHRLTKQLEDMKARTKRGNYVWRLSLVKCMLNSYTYIGTKYYNTVRKIREYANPFSNVKETSCKLVRRDREDWVGVPVPAIVSRELWDKAQERLAYNRRRYRNPRRIQLLSSLVACGNCGHSCYAYQRYVKKKRKIKPTHISYKMAYKCGWRLRQGWHSKQTQLERCYTKEVKSEILEAWVFKVVENAMLVPAELRKHMDFFRDSRKSALMRMEKRLREVDQKIRGKEQEKQRIVDLYARGDLGRQGYVRKSLDYDQAIADLKVRQVELARRVPLLRKTELVNTSVDQYCEAAKVRYAKCADFETKRQFLLDYVERIVFWGDKVTVCGSVPVKAETETRIEFKITDYSY